ncbi:MAG TPA: colicin immunity domain-containing protein [Pirellulales bacterium]|jgi:hypothetical protein|nr:colicin immunity domain-containing protein [Pirellulales bacterium]
MSAELLRFATRFATGDIAAGDSVNTYIERWKSERDGGECKQDNDAISECLSSIFCVADLYEPSESRKDYELSEAGLRERVNGFLAALKP